MKIKNKYDTPVIGFVAFSGTGKTTLLAKLIPALKERGLKIALVKHSHHHFDIDHPGKDSYRLRKAGADQIVIASKKRLAWIAEYQHERDEPSLTDALAALNMSEIDIVLVEGFKGESFPKVELHRSELNKPYLYPEDNDIIAVVTDNVPADSEDLLTFLDINQTEDIAVYVQQYCDDYIT